MKNVFWDRRRIFRTLSIVALVAILIVPPLFYKRFEEVKEIGYLGFFVANYFGYGLYVLPFLVTKLDPTLLILIGAFGSTVDEFFAWYAGRTSEQYERRSRLHAAIEKYISRYGLMAVAMMGVLPLPGFVLTIAGFIGGHYGIPYLKYFLAGFLGRLVSRTFWTLGFLFIMK